MSTSSTTGSLTALFKEVYADKLSNLFNGNPFFRNISKIDPEFERNKEFDDKLKEIFDGKQEEN